MFNRQPFSANTQLFANSAPPTTHNGSSASYVGGAAPQGQVVGVRRDFTMVPQFIPGMSVVGGLKQPPRG